MHAALRSNGCRRLCLALFALVAVTIGFAHVSVGIDLTPAPVAAEYELPGGIVPTLCVRKDTAAFASHHPGELCSVCLLTGAPEAIELPPVLPIVLTLSTWLPQPAGRDDLSEVDAPLSRGPPLARTVV
ncbi:hypothetical protein [Methyloraptor flagellatus]|uniref:DUF2946 domain-containing protein n=1 Tax=Methyloraptor flagellatus TaxID=3162530 RepID=A0AAU7X4R6_9HYPH